MNGLGTIKLSDFGAQKLLLDSIQTLGDDHDAMKNENVYWLAPEII